MNWQAGFALIVFFVLDPGADFTKSGIGKTPYSKGMGIWYKETFNESSYFMTAVQNGARQIPMKLVVVAAIFLQHNAVANPTPTMVDLGTASIFAGLAGTAITDAGGAFKITGRFLELIKDVI